MSTPLVIASRFNGPPTSGNGGYVSGRLARELQERRGKVEAVEVTLRAALTLDKPLDVRDRPDSGVSLYDGDQLLAEAVATSLALDVPTPPSLDEARAAGVIGRMRSASGNAYLKCFGCGMSRAEHEGLRLNPTPVGEADQVASDWIPHEAFADEDGTVPAEIVWTALDCPAGFAWGFKTGDGNAGLLTGRITLAQSGEVRAGQTYIVTAWPLEREGRKLHAGAALHDAEGRLVAWSRQLWFGAKG
ncbi:MAG: hypothetical protein IH616_02080 [Gemmatimonadales bacterium]|nr:hypothetical protein [Gemmatimonadales bacterium]